VQPILSIRDLAAKVGIPVDRLRQIGRDIDAHYKIQPLRQGTKVRMLAVPGAELKMVQRRINRAILAKVPLARTVYGGVAGGSSRKNAGEHARQPCVITMDVKEFFPNVRHYMVYRMFSHELGFGKDVASILTRLTTYRSYLPQGAPTSTAVANLVLAAPVDVPMSAQAERLGVRYSRFVDDIAISGTNPRPLINKIAKLLSSRRLPMHRMKLTGRSKLRIMPIGRTQSITGLVVNSPTGLSVPRLRRDKIRAAVFALRRAPKHELEHAVASICGRIAHVEQFNPGSAGRLKKYLESTLRGRV
jgi:RNA-directed DNA polymerase